MNAGVVDIAAVLGRLRAAAGEAAYPLRLPGADDARRDAAALAGQIDDYLLPRLARLDAPMLVVVGGSTGAGKSTLVNSLIREPVTPAGVLRPTTRAPVLVCAPADERWYAEAHILPGLPRGGDGLRIVAVPALTPGLAYLDAPDIDSVVDTNRALANQLLAAADLWLFVTTAARYADAVPWDVLHTARARGTALAIALNRVPADAGPEVSADLRGMLSDHDLGDAPLFVLAESVLDERGLLGEDVTPLADWFAGLAADAEGRAAVIRRTLDGALAAVPVRLGDLADAADVQTGAVADLAGTARSVYDAALETVTAGLNDGALLRGEVLARWQEFVGTGELLRALQARVGRLRDQITAALTGRAAPGRTFRAALASGLAALLTNAATDAAERAAASWRQHPAGAALLAGATRAELHRPAPDLPERIDRLVRDWQGAVLDLVRTEGAGKRSLARLSAYTVNATGLLVMIGVFASTAFIPTGAEIAVAGGTTVLSQKVLEAIFGDQAVRGLAARARENLLNRVRSLLDVERRRFDDLLDDARVPAEAAQRLRGLAAEVETARAPLHEDHPATLPPGPPLPVAPAPEPEAAAGDEVGAPPNGESAESPVPKKSAPRKKAPAGGKPSDAERSEVGT